MNRETIAKLKKFKTLDDIIASDILPESVKKVLESTDKSKSDIDRICSAIADQLDK